MQEFQRARIMLASHKRSNELGSDADRAASLQIAPWSGTSFHDLPECLNTDSGTAVACQVRAGPPCIRPWLKGAPRLRPQGTGQRPTCRERHGKNQVRRKCRKKRLVSRGPPPSDMQDSPTVSHGSQSIEAGFDNVKRCAVSAKPFTSPPVSPGLARPPTPAKGIACPLRPDRLHVEAGPARLPDPASPPEALP